MGSTTPTHARGVEDRRGRILVLGAGSSGLTAAKNLRERGFDVDLVEREPHVGGNWNIEGSASRVYESTRMISSKPFTQFPDFPMPDAAPDYLHHSHVRDYLERYAAHFGLDRIVELSTTVAQVTPLARGFDVEVTGPDGVRRARRYGRLVIANGHNWAPKWPSYPGQDAFNGELLHSADYRSGDQLAGRRVVVIGAGNTGCDIAVEAAHRAEATYHSTRRAYWYAPKYAFGKPADQVSDLIFALRLPTRVTQTLFQATARLVVGRYERYGLPTPDHRFLETHPIVNQQLLYHVGHGAITPKPDVACFEGDEVVFTDGSRVHADLVLFATGYLISFPFLPAGAIPGGAQPRLLRNVLHPERTDLAVIGLIQPDSGQFALVHWQSVLLASFLELDRREPAAARAYLADAARHLDDRSQAGIALVESTRHLVEVEHAAYARDLERDLADLARRLAAVAA